ncbi:MAG: hypothetical protein A2998_02475 [Candidatus Staskawiczbacteria bacterium RIFCSPLOWO2_01_FULL_37_25b]|uniref:Sodium/calcium exchanger membrane region domain-containing protein n=1 Tax=Candidatus Staskawiczbacteria bacterium RIFCSPLOWO2_01_FULL_37_25b TaxID=1802213 RepID=A0A1G2IEJ3_9BACT|nr:MAG: hypothetical protein A2998_02475 [Candidatus Staskawiczbacteria bacterium RIFCSPLOWO2_01_FULL_37_25b]
MFLQIAIFISACLALSWLSKSLIRTLVQIAKFLRWREFIVGFFVMAVATSLPNLFVDVNAALRGIPQLAFGDVLGGNFVDLTLVLGLAVLFSKKPIPAESKMVQQSALFTAVIAVLPLFLIFDGNITRLDGAILLLAFVFYSWWIFSKEERFKKVYPKSQKLRSNAWEITLFIKNIIKLVLLLALLLAASQVIIDTANFFTLAFGTSLAMVGILIIGLGNCFPEVYFSIVSAREGRSWMILGDLMGSVIMCSTLILGIIALIKPFEIVDFSPFFIVRIFTVAAAIFSIFIIRTGKKITKKEGLFLIFLYILFLFTEILLK